LGDGRLAYGDGLYAAYYTVKSRSGHYGDQFVYVNDNGVLQPGGWDWGCSHSLAELVSYHPDLDKFIAVCSSDCYPVKGILINSSAGNRVYEAAGSCTGLVSAQLGQAALHQGGWKLLFNAVDEPCCDGRGIGLATIGQNYQSSLTWLTQTNGATERDPVMARLGTGLQSDRYLVGWTTTDDKRYWLAIIDGAGTFIIGPGDVTPDGVRWGNRDDSFRTQPDGSVSWVRGDPKSRELYLFFFKES
jgi:hypothetical protein